MQLQEQHSDKLVVLTLNVDFDSEGSPTPQLMEKVSQTLANFDITCDNYICSTPVETVLEDLKLFGLPAAIIYNGAGQLEERFDGKVDLESSVPEAIRALLQR